MVCPIEGSMLNHAIEFYNYLYTPKIVVDNLPSYQFHITITNVLSKPRFTGLVRGSKRLAGGIVLHALVSFHTELEPSMQRRWRERGRRGTESLWRPSCHCQTWWKSKGGAPHSWSKQGLGSLFNFLKKTLVLSGEVGNTIVDFNWKSQRKKIETTKIKNEARAKVSILIRRRM